MKHQQDLFEIENARSLLDQLLEDSRLYHNSTDYKQLLDFVVKLRNFAPFNAMLLHIQKPGISYAASATDWRERFNRYPKRDARPLLILWPFAPVVLVYDLIDTEGEPTSKTASCGADEKTSTASSGCGDEQPSVRIEEKGKYSGVWQEAWSDFVDVLPYLLIGIAIGSVIYGFMPTDLLEQYAGPDNPFAIPIAAIIGVPLYIRAEAVIPLAAALMTKGVGAGTVLALIIGSAGASLTELILLRSLFTLKLLAAFVAVIFAMAMIAGYATYLFF